MLLSESDQKSAIIIFLLTYHRWTYNLFVFNFQLLSSVKNGIFTGYKLALFAQYLKVPTFSLAYGNTTLYAPFPQLLARCNSILPANQMAVHYPCFSQAHKYFRLSYISLFLEIWCGFAAVPYIPRSAPFIFSPSEPAIRIKFNFRTYPFSHIFTSSRAIQFAGHSISMSF